MEVAELMGKAERNKYIDFTKFICMVAVIMIHCSFRTKFGLIIKNLCAFAVPLFFVWSGFFAYNCGFSKLGKRIKRMIIMLIEANLFYVVWDIFYLNLTNENASIFFSEAISFKKLIIMLTLNESPFRGHLWFIGALINCYIFIVLFERLLSVKVAIIMSALLLIGGLVLQYFLITNQMQDKVSILVRNWVFDGLPFFLLGFSLSRLTKYQIKQQSFLFTICILLFFNVIEIMAVGYGRVYYLSTILLVMCICLGYRNQVDGYSKVIIVLSKLFDKYGLLVYIIQVAVIKTYDLLILSLYGEINSIVYIFIRPFILTVIIVSISAVIYKMKQIILYLRGMINPL